MGKPPCHPTDVSCLCKSQRHTYCANTYSTSIFMPRDQLCAFGVHPHHKAGSRLRRAFLTYTGAVLLLTMADCTRARRCGEKAVREKETYYLSCESIQSLCVGSHRRSSAMRVCDFSPSLRVARPSRFRTRLEDISAVSTLRSIGMERVTSGSFAPSACSMMKYFENLSDVHVVLQKRFGGTRGQEGWPQIRYWSKQP